MSGGHMRSAGLLCWLLGAALLTVLCRGTAALAVSVPAPGPGAASTAHASAESTANAEADDVLREEWSGGIFRSSYRFGICVKANGEARGVLLLRAPSGKVDVYHVRGTRLADGKIVVQHSSGHRLEGRLVDERRAACKIKLKNSLRLSTTATRNPDAHLSVDTCRPL